jgi:hypothetical protein
MMFSPLCLSIPEGIDKGRQRGQAKAAGVGALERLFGLKRQTPRQSIWNVTRFGGLKAPLVRGRLAFRHAIASSSNCPTTSLRLGRMAYFSNSASISAPTSGVTRAKIWRDLNVGQAASYSAFIRASLAGERIRLSERRGPGAMAGLPIIFRSLMEQ